jgi:putative intracellular protease/amidase
MFDTPLRILLPLPDRDFDTTEAAALWDAATSAGHEVVFATEHGAIPTCDPHLLGPGWRNPRPAKPHVVEMYRRMTADPHYFRPLTYDEIDPADFDAVHLPGGHSRGIKQYLDNAQLQRKIATFQSDGKVIGAICHGTLVLARARDQKTGKSLLDGRTVTTLTKPAEKRAFMRTFCRVGRRYRTYWKYTETEVRRALGPHGHLERGDARLQPFTVVDGLIVTARYPVDIGEYSTSFLQLLESTSAQHRGNPRRA